MTRPDALKSVTGYIISNPSHISNRSSEQNRTEHLIDADTPPNIRVDSIYTTVRKAFLQVCSADNIVLIWAIRASNMEMEFDTLRRPRSP